MTIRLWRRIFLGFFFLSWFPGVAASADIQPGDPSIGSYVYFVALDRRCSVKNPDRAAALEGFRQHYLANMRKLLSSLPESQAKKMQAMLRELEANGPSSEKLDKFDGFFSQGTQREIDALCESAPKDIADRMAMENKLAQALAGAGIAPGGDRSVESIPYASRERLEREGPPFGFLSIQHFYAILKRCETVSPAPEAIHARQLAFERLLDGARTLNGLWRTYFDAEGQLKETRFPTARKMVSSPEFAQDVKRYERSVFAVALATQREDCSQFEQLVTQALSK